jgi:hypothetical protein
MTYCSKIATADAVADFVQGNSTANLLDNSDTFMTQSTPGWYIEQICSAKSTMGDFDQYLFRLQGGYFGWRASHDTIDAAHIKALGHSCG